MNRLKSGWLVVAIVLLVGCAASVPPAVGVWNMEMNTPLGDMEAIFTVNADGSGSVGIEALGGDTAISGITFDGNMMAFTGEFDAQGQTIVLEFTGTVDGDSLDGEFDSDFGAFAVSGTRQ